MNLLLERKDMTNPDSISKSRDITATSAKSLHSCPILCDPIDGSQPGSPIPGILQARTLEWVAIPSPVHESESEVAQSCSNTLPTWFEGRVESLEKTLMLGKTEGRRRREWQRTRWLDGITDSIGMNLGKLWEMRWWGTGKPGVLQSMGSQRVEHDDWTATTHGFI